MEYLWFIVLKSYFFFRLTFWFFIVGFLLCQWLDYGNSSLSTPFNFFHFNTQSNDCVCLRLYKFELLHTHVMWAAAAAPPPQNTIVDWTLFVHTVIWLLTFFYSNNIFWYLANWKQRKNETTTTTSTIEMRMMRT